MKMEVATGIQDFESLRVNQRFYVDKTEFIRKWWNGGDIVTLIMAGRSTWATFGGLRLKRSNRQEKNSICRIYTHKEGNRDAAALLYEGFLYGEAMDEELMIYYIEKFGAMRIPREHPYSISFSGKVTKRISEVYEYVWTDEEP